MKHLNNILLWVEGPMWTFAQKGWKLIVIAILVLILMQTCHKNTQLKEQINGAKAIDSFVHKGLDSSVVYWKDRYNTEHAIAEKMTGTIVSTKYTDSITKLLNIKTKQLESIAQTRIQTHLDASLRDSIVYQDTCFDKAGNIVINASQRDVSYDDPWNSIRGSVGDYGNFITYTGTDTLTTVDYWQRDKVLGLRIGKVRGYVDYTHKNIYTKITGAKKIDLNPPKQRYSLGIGVSVGYAPFLPFNLKKPYFTIGLSLHRDIIKF